MSGELRALLRDTYAVDRLDVCFTGDDVGDSGGDDAGTAPTLLATDLGAGQVQVLAKVARQG